MSKKATKHKSWNNIKHVIFMGDEVNVEDMQPRHVYSVLKLSKGEGSLNYDWGIAIVGNNGQIFRNYNLNAEGVWDANNCRIRRTWRIYNADSLSMDFATLFLAHLTVTKNLDSIEAQMDEMEKKLYKLEHQSLWERIMNR